MYYSSFMEICEAEIWLCIPAGLCPPFPVTPFPCAPFPLPPISSASAQLIAEIMEAATSWQSSAGRGKERRVPCASWTPSPLPLLHPLQLCACCSFNGSRRTFSYFPSFFHSPELQEDLLAVGDGGKPAHVALVFPPCSEWFLGCRDGVGGPKGVHSQEQLPILVRFNT